MQVVDLGCGTGLCAPLFRPLARYMVGIDLSPGMLAIARQQRGHLYDALLQGDGAETLLSLSASELRRRSRGSPSTGGSVDLVLAADVFVYVGELERTMRACAHVLRVGGLLAFTVEELELPPPALDAVSGTPETTTTQQQQQRRRTDAHGQHRPRHELVLQASGRYAHSRAYVGRFFFHSSAEGEGEGEGEGGAGSASRTSHAAPFHLEREESVVVRHEAGVPVASVLFVLRKV